MRIAQIAPLFESVPPRRYGGTERVVSYLTEQLVANGHDVTLFASGDSITRARLVAGSKRALRLDPDCVDPLALQVALQEKVWQSADEFDILHFHTDYLHFPAARRARCAQVTTLHGRLDIAELVPVFHEFDEMPLVSISESQRAPLAFANWLATVQHGLPAERFRFDEEGGEYFAFVGRMSPEKRVDRAIDIALRLQRPIRIAAKVDRVDRDYFETQIAPLMRHPLVEFLGEVTENQKVELLGKARALLFPIDWPEPFGLVMIEALACGTPVVAYRHGSVPEVIEHGRSGFIVDTFDQAVEAADRVSELSRQACRLAFEQRFTATRMAQRYVDVYRRLIAKPTMAARALPVSLDA